MIDVFFRFPKILILSDPKPIGSMTTKLQFTALLILVGTLNAAAGTLSYVAVAPVQSDMNCGIDNRNQYTTAVDGGNASGNNRVINGVTLYALAGSGQSASADNCTVNVLTGTLANSQRVDSAPQADGTFAEILSGMTSNDGASDNSQQEIVLDPASLTPGTAYDLRIYIANSGASDREANLAFVGDGQPPAETGFFNEDDARTSPGGFRDPNQVYYIDYRFNWDGSSTPGVTITQKSGQAPFALYAVTNQPVTEQGAAAAAPIAQAAPAPETASAALVSAAPDQVGVTSETFYSHESLKKHGRWVEVKKYGRCWQPTDVPKEWRPYSRGHFAYSDDGGYVWIADPAENDWGWACYHYGRWCRVPGVGSGWAWVPGTAWSGAWVSWRQGRDRDHSFVGWAPLPPEATLREGIGISTWADREYDIGPDYYTFINVRDFGSESYWRPGLIVDRRRYVDILPHTVNITNINYTNTRGGVSNVTITQVRAYDGGPDFTFINTEIRQRGGREIARIQVNRVGTENFNGGFGSRLEGNTFVVFTPQVKREANQRILPQVAATIPDNKIDHGWAEVKNQKLKTQLKNDIAQQVQGQTTATNKAVLPPQVIQAAAQSAATIPAPGQSPQPSGLSTTASPAATVASQTAGAPPTPVATSPIQSPVGAVAGTSPLPAISQPSGSTKTLHPGQKLTAPAVATGQPTAPPAGSTSPASGSAITAARSTEPQQTAAPKVLHPGQRLESKPMQSPAVATNAASPSPTAGLAQSPVRKVQHPGEKMVSAPGQSPAAVREASPTPSRSSAVPTTQVAPSPASRLHPGVKIAATPVQLPPSGVAGASASPVLPTQSPAKNVQALRNQLATPVPEESPRSVTAVSPSPSPQGTRAVTGHQNQPRGQAENKPILTPIPVPPQITSTPPQIPATRERTTAKSVEAVPTPQSTQVPAATRKATPPEVTREHASPSGTSQQQLQTQQIEERIRQQQQQKQQEQVEQKFQQQQTQQHQQQLEQEQKVKQQEQKQAQQAQQLQAQQKQQEATQLKERHLQQQQAEQKRSQQEAQAKQQQEAAQQKQRQLQLQQEQAQQKQQQLAAQKKEKEFQQQAQAKQEAVAQQKERQAQQLKEQQAQQRQQELKQQQAAQQKEQQLRQQQQQQQARQQQLQQQQLQQQQAEQRQQQLRQQQQQNRRAATPTPSPGG